MNEADRGGAGSNSSRSLNTDGHGTELCWAEGLSTANALESHCERPNKRKKNTPTESERAHALSFGYCATISATFGGHLSRWLNGEPQAP